VVIKPTSTHSSTSNMDTQNFATAATFLAPAISLATAGSILTLSYYAVPVIRSTSAELSTKTALGQLRALFSSGSHVYPPLSAMSSTLYAFLAYSIPAKRTGFGLAALGAMGIAPFTIFVMVPAANGRLIELDKRAKAGGFEGEKGNKEVDGLLRSFENLNGARAAIMATGGLVGLWVALA
jgi:hypothetical protein